MQENVKKIKEEKEGKLIKNQPREIGSPGKRKRRAGVLMWWFISWVNKL